MHTKIVLHDCTKPINNGRCGTGFCFADGCFYRFFHFAVGWRHSVSTHESTESSIHVLRIPRRVNLLRLNSLRFDSEAGNFLWCWLVIWMFRPFLDLEKGSGAGFDCCRLLEWNLTTKRWNFKTATVLLIPWLNKNCALQVVHRFPGWPVVFCRPRTLLT